jgi:hypothetical protein
VRPFLLLLFQIVSVEANPDELRPRELSNLVCARKRGREKRER